MIGRVKRIFAAGYGFIHTDENEEFFFHVSAYKGDWKELIANSPPNKEEGPLVYFKEQVHPRGPRAYVVELVPSD